MHRQRGDDRVGRAGDVGCRLGERPRGAGAAEVGPRRAGRGWWGGGRGGLAAEGEGGGVMCVVGWARRGLRGCKFAFLVAGGVGGCDAVWYGGVCCARRGYGVARLRFSVVGRVGGWVGR